MNPTIAGIYSTEISHEPDEVSGSELTLEGEKGLREEFNQMKESVEKYGGFYIGRYETGDIDKQIPVVIKENKKISNESWDKMYEISKNAVQNQNAKIESRMIWGCQWDATLNWFLSSRNNSVKNFVTKSIGGAYSDTGVTESNLESGYYAVNNIYDMGGNVWEYTLEANANSDGRINRGCSYINHSSSGRASDRGSAGYTYKNYSYLGFRLTLCI